MKIHIAGREPIDIGGKEVELEGCYCGVGIKTDQGLFGVAQRDGGVEVMLNGKLVWSSTSQTSSSALPVASVSGDADYLDGMPRSVMLHGRDHEGKSRPREYHQGAGLTSEERTELQNWLWQKRHHRIADSDDRIGPGSTLLVGALRKLAERQVTLSSAGAIDEDGS